MALNRTYLQQIFFNKHKFSIGSIRLGHHLRGKPPGIARSIDQRLSEINHIDQSLYFRVDIGLPPKKHLRSKQLQERLQILRDHRNPQLEQLSRKNQLVVDLKNVHANWLETSSPQHIKKVADHYGIYEHLFREGYFYPRVPLNVAYQVDNVKKQVYSGNLLMPADCQVEPSVEYNSDNETLWTLLLTNPDGQFINQDMEHVHWFVGNIPGSQVQKGETIFNYLRPFPPKGTGYQRLVFILYKQTNAIDYSDLKKSGECLDLTQRTFSTYNFYRERQNQLTPAGLAFYQTSWDESLKDFFHNKLDMTKPIYEYDFPPPFIKKQEWFPLRKAFNTYMDRYRDPKQINKEFLERKLKKVHPFKAPPLPVPYPNAMYFEGYQPSWLKLEKRKSRKNMGRILDIQ